MQIQQAGALPGAIDDCIGLLAFSGVVGLRFASSASSAALLFFEASYERDAALPSKTQAKKYAEASCGVRISDLCIAKPPAMATPWLNRQRRKP